MARGDWRGLLLHSPATLLWLIGITYMLPAIARRAGSPLRSLNGWLVAAGVIGFCAFPGIGTTCCTVAYLGSYLLRSRKAAAEDDNDLLKSMVVPAIAGRSVEGLRAHQAQPLVDLLREQNTELRRVVVKTLGEQGDEESVRMIRTLLADLSPDVRSDAAVTLTRLEDQYNDRMRDAIDEMQANPTDAEQAYALARLCYRYAKNGLLDAVSSEYYLERARSLLDQLTRRMPHRVDIALDYARVLFELRAMPEAQAALDHVLTLRPDHRDAFLLSVEIAFSEQQWDRLLALSRQRQDVPEATRDLLRWWADLAPGGTHRG
jgi:hypothetical protein